MSIEKNIELWTRFTEWWTRMLEESIPPPPYPAVVFLKEEGKQYIGECQTYTYEVEYWSYQEELLAEKGLTLSEDSQRRRLLDFSKAEPCKATEISVQETFDADDVRSYCMECWDRNQDSYRGDDPSHDEEVCYEMKDFVKFFSAWRGGFVKNIPQANRTVWEDQEIEEIFNILSMYVDMDEKAAQGFDNHIAAYRLLAIQIANYDR